MILLDLIEHLSKNWFTPLILNTYLYQGQNHIHHTDYKQIFGWNTLIMPFSSMVKACGQWCQYHCKIPYFFE